MPEMGLDSTTLGLIVSCSTIWAIPGCRTNCLVKTYKVTLKTRGLSPNGGRDGGGGHIL